MGTEIGVITMKNSKEGLQKIKKVELPYDPGIPFLNIYSRKLKPLTNSKRYTHPYFHCSSVYSSQDVETNVHR